MGIFDIDKTANIIKNEEILSYDYVPKVLPYRENQIQEIANSIKPMLYERSGRNLFIYGAPGIGKTASIKWVLRELSENTDEVIPIYVNCWNLKTKYFIFSEMANQLKISFTAGKSAEHILQQIIYKLKNKRAVFVFDEIDKIDDSDFLYQIVSTFPTSSIHLISNNFEYVTKIDSRIRSRLMLKHIEFKPYSLNEIYGILKERVRLALRKDAIDTSLLKQIANITYNKGDVRVGLYLIRESAKLAEQEGKRKVSKEHIKKAMENVLDKTLEEEKLNKDEMLIVEIVKEHDGEVSGKLYEIYKKKGGELSYKSFKRYTKNLEKLGLLRLELTAGGFKGKSTRIYLNTH
ncbi:MAG: AAA family ATPase [Nanoarchaeota archaeon]|nr:AAA family ATPase [Nanoarchaeota archaeon]